ncbi:MAG: DoxX family protein [Pseudorhizobium sp.]
MAGAHDDVLPPMARLESWRTGCRVVLAGSYGLAGILHVAVPGPFLRITPSWVPEPEAVVMVTGLCEIAGAIGLLVPNVRKYAGVGLALYAVCVFPANIKHAYDALNAASVSPWQWLYHGLRLPLQPLLAWLPLFAAGLVWTAGRGKSLPR